MSFLLVFLINLFGIISTQSMEVELTSGQVEPSPIAVSEFLDPTDVDAVGISSVIKEDLKHTAIFRVLESGYDAQSSESMQLNVNYSGWQKSGATFLVSGKLIRLSNGMVEISFSLYNVVSKVLMVSVNFKIHRKNLRRAAHLISDAIYERVCGDRGYFDTRIAYISEIDGGKTKRLTLSDFDGYNKIYLTSGGNFSLTPRFSPDGKNIAYLEFDKVGTAIVYIYNLASKKTSKLGAFKGLSISPRFSPDGKTVVFSLARNGSTAIYKYLRESQELVKLTDNKSGYISTSPCYSPDSKKIIFTSDRAKGREKIYLMDHDGESNLNSAVKISKGEGTYSQPVWSPRGDIIAFTKKYQGQFYIGVMKTDGSDERLIATGWLVEAPVWSPNGRLIMFAREEKIDNKKTKRQLYTVDLSGFHLHSVKNITQASDPAWSPSTSKSLLSNKSKIEKPFDLNNSKKN